jgi:hypothetical protein
MPTLGTLLRLGLPFVSWKESTPASAFVFGGKDEDEVAFAVQQVGAKRDWSHGQPLPHLPSAVGVQIPHPRT